MDETDGDKAGGTPARRGTYGGETDEKDETDEGFGDRLKAGLRAETGGRRTAIS